MGCGPSKEDVARIEAKLDSIDLKLDGGQISDLFSSENGAKSATKGGRYTQFNATVARKRRADGRYDVFISHAKKLSESEDRAVWVAD